MSKIYKSDVFNVKFNQRGVAYFREMFTGRIVAKQCTRCVQWKFLNEFNKAKKGFAGYHSLCRGCHKQNNVEYREALKVDAHIIALHEKTMTEYVTKLHNEEQERLHAEMVKRSLVNSLG